MLETFLVIYSLICMRLVRWIHLVIFTKLDYMYFERLGKWDVSLSLQTGGCTFFCLRILPSKHPPMDESMVILSRASSVRIIMCSDVITNLRGIIALRNKAL